MDKGHGNAIETDKNNNKQTERTTPNTKLIGCATVARTLVVQSSLSCAVDIDRIVYNCRLLLVGPGTGFVQVSP